MAQWIPASLKQSPPLNVAAKASPFSILCRASHSPSLPSSSPSPLPSCYRPPSRLFCLLPPTSSPLRTFTTFSSIGLSSCSLLSCIFRLLHRARFAIPLFPLLTSSLRLSHRLATHLHPHLHISLSNLLTHKHPLQRPSILCIHFELLNSIRKLTA